MDMAVIINSSEDQECLRLLRRWRDGEVIPVISRELLRDYVRHLNKIGCPDEILKWWIIWLTHPRRSWYLAELDKANDLDRSRDQIYADIAQATGVTMVVGPPNLQKRLFEPDLTAMSCSTFLKIISDGQNTGENQLS